MKNSRPKYSVNTKHVAYIYIYWCTVYLEKENTHLRNINGKENSQQISQFADYIFAAVSCHDLTVIYGLNGHGLWCMFQKYLIL